MSRQIDLIVENDFSGVRIDKFLAENIDFLTRSMIVGLIDDGNVSVFGKKAQKSYKCKVNDEITVIIPAPKALETKAENIPLDIVYEDDDLLVVNKPKGMVVHPAPGNYEGTLVNALLYHCGSSLSGINGVIRPGIVHRIDKDTSGLLIVAKNDFSHLHLAKQIKEHSFYRAYHAVVYGNIKEDKGTVNEPIGRNPKDRKKMAVVYNNSRNAITHYEVIERFGSFTHIKCILETGRTHQIRVHMAYLGHALAGDSVYGPKKVITKLSGQCLHAGEIGFIHPRTNEYLHFTSPLPEYFTNFLAELERKN